MKTVFLSLILSILLAGCVTSRYKNGQLVSAKIAETTCDFEKFSYDKKAFADFHNSLVRYLSRMPASVKDKDFLIKQVTYPLVVNNSKETKIYQKSNDVLTSFNEIFDTNTIDTIRAHRLVDVKCSLKGISYGDGLVWVGLDEQKKFKIYSINHLQSI